MNKSLIFCTLLLHFYVVGQQYPETKQLQNTTEKHGITIQDNYKWLEKFNNADVKNWIAAQNEFSDKHFEEITKKYPFAGKIKEYISLSTNGLPTKKGKYFYSLYRKDKTQSPSLYYRKDLNDMSIEIFNPFKVTKNKDNFISNFYPSKNSKYAAVEISLGGSDRHQVRFCDIDKNIILNDSINDVKFSNIVWNFDRGIYYKKNSNQIATTKDSTFQIFYHTIGTLQKDDKLVYDALKLESKVHFFKSEDKLVIVEDTDAGKNYRSIKLDIEDYTVTNLIENDTTNFTFRHYSKDKFYYSSKEYDWGEIRYFDVKNKSEEIVLIPQIYNHLLLDAVFLDKYIVCKYKTVGKNYISIYDLEGQFIRKFEAPLGFDFSIKFYDAEKENLFVSFYSYTISYQNFKLNIKSGEIRQYYNDYIQPKPTTFPLDYFETKILTFENRDGIDIPITIVHKKGIKLDGNNPTLLTAYGGFGLVSSPSFDPGLLCFLDKGGVFCYAEIRGGGEKGQKWHRSGRRLNKNNSFNDFIDTAEYLIAEKYTSPAKLGISGASNGGLLVGAAMTKRPDLFKVAIPQVGVFDMTNFDMYTAGTFWKNEYGNPNNSIDFKNLYSYSPLHHIDSNINYPITLVITGENDDRVVPSHSYKFAAKLQNNPAQTNPIFLYTNSGSGHSGKMNYKGFVDAKALFYSFLLYHLTK